MPFDQRQLALALVFALSLWALARGPSAICGGLAVSALFWTNPSKNMAVVFIIQNLEQQAHYRPALQNMVYEAQPNPAQ